MTLERAKETAGKQAALLIKPNTIVGLGTGSTANYFIKALIERCHQGLKIQAVASSRASAELAAPHIPLLDINDAPRIDITVDGADEVDPLKRMIKGGGGAHVREKILAAAATETLIIVDETKLVSHLGRHKLPVEVLFFGAPSTRTRIEQAGYSGAWRLNPDNTLFITENGNLLFDITFPSPLLYPEKEEEKLIHIAGVVSTGFFFHLATRVLVGHLDGTTHFVQE